MLPGLLKAASQEKRRGFRSPSGRFYEWTKDTPPTQADIEAIVAFDEANKPSILGTPKNKTKPRVVTTSKEGPMKDKPRVKPQPQVARRPSLLDSLTKYEATEAEREAVGTGFKTMTGTTGASPAERKVADAKVAAQTTQASAKEIRENVNRATEAVAAKLRPYMPDLAAEMLAGTIMVPGNTLAELDTLLSISGGADVGERVGAAANLILQWAPLGVAAKYGGRVGSAGVAAVRGGAEAAQQGKSIIKGAKQSAVASDAIRTVSKSGIQGAPAPRGIHVQQGAETPPPDAGLAEQLKETLEKTRRGEFNEFVPPNKYEQAAEAKAAQKAQEFNEGLEAMTTAKKADPPPTEGTAAKNEWTTAAREEMGLEELPKAERESFEGWLEKAQSEGLDRTTSSVAERVLKEGGTMSAEETAAATLRLAELKAQHKAILRQVDDLDDGATISAKSAELSAIEAEFDQLTKAVKEAGTAAGRSLVSRKLTLNDQLDLISVQQRAKARKGEALTTDEKDALATLTRDYEAAQVRIKDLEDALAADNFTAARPSKKRKTTAELDAERDEAVKALKDALKKTTAKVSSGVDVEGVGEIAAAIAKLARNYIERGFLKLDDVIGKIKEDFPELSDRQIRDAISGYGQKQGVRTVREATRLRNEMIKEARLLSQIEDAMAGVYKPGRSPGKASPKIRALMSQLDAILKEQGVRKTISDDARLDRLRETLAKLQKGIEDAPRGRKPDPAAIAAVKEEIRRLRTLRRYEAEIKDLTEQLETGVFKERERRTRPIVKELDDAKYQRDKLRDEINRRIEAAKPKTTLDKALDVYSFPRSIVASSDNSFPFNQGAMIMLMEPKAWAQGFAKSWKSLTDRGFYKVMQEVREHPRYEVAERAGLFEQGADLSDQFGAKGFSKVPIIGHSERGYVGAGNVMRLHTFDKWAEIMEMKKGGPLTIKEYKRIAREVKTFTGQGVWGKNIQSISRPFMALRYTLSQIEIATFAPMFRALADGDKALAKLILQKQVKAYAAYGSILGVAEYAMGGFSDNNDRTHKIDLSPSSTNWGRYTYKPKGGDAFTMDLLPPGMQVYKPVYQYLTSQKEATTGNVRKGYGVDDQVVGEFLTNRMHPTLSFLNTLRESRQNDKNEHFGKSFDFTGNTGEALKNTGMMATPITLQNMAEILESDDFTPEEKAAMLSLAPLLRLGVQKK